MIYVLMIFQCSLQIQIKTLMSHFSSSAASHLRYAACSDGAQVVAAQNEFLAKEEEEQRRRKDEIDLPPTYSSDEYEDDEDDVEQK